MTVDCKWNDWVIGECTKSCGGGVRINVRTKNISAAYGGAIAMESRTIFWEIATFKIAQVIENVFRICFIT